MSKGKIIFVLIIALAIFLRFFNLSSVPPGPSLDEVSIGYNAYSILNTGNDEYGTKFPILLRAYDDWRPAIYVYLVIPFIKIFGLNVLAVRLPSVILSVLTIIATYYVTIEIMRISKVRAKANMVALFSIFLLAISPWHIYLSRLGHEANAGLAFFVFALFFFLRNRFYLSFTFFALSFASYQSEKVFIPLFVISLLLIFNKVVVKNIKKIILASLLSLLILTPFIRETFSPNALIRFKGTNVFNTSEERFYKQSIKLKEAVERNDIIGKIIYNRRLVGLEIFEENFFSHFNPVWLFTNFSADAHKVPNIGLLYIWEFPLLIAGFAALKKFDRKIQLLVIFWLMFAPLPAAITTGAPHAMRAYTFLPCFQIISAIGMVSIFNFFQDKRVRYTMAGTFAVIAIFSLAYLYYQYFIIFPRTQSSSFQYALSNAISYVIQNQSNYNKIIFSNKDNLFQSYMFFLFYSKYDPSLYQKQGGTKSGGFAQSHEFGKYSFKNINSDVLEEGVFYLANPSELTDKNTAKSFNYLNGDVGVKTIEKKAYAQ